MLLNQYGHPYRAAEHSRLTSHLPARSRSTPHEQRMALETLVARSRFVYRNNPLAHSLIDYFVRNMAGAGLRIQARLRTGEASELMREENAALEDFFTRWQGKGITPRKMRAHNFFKLGGRHALVDGEVFALKLENPRREGVTREYKLMRGDMCPYGDQQAPGVPAANRVIQGVELDPDDRIVFYHFYDDGHSHYWTGNDTRTLRRVPAEQVIHWKLGEAADAVRGTPILTPIILDIADLGEFKAAVLTQAWAQANVVAFIKSAFPAELQEAAREALVAKFGDSILSGLSEQEKYQEAMVPGVKEYLAPGEEVEFASPNSPSNNFGPFCEHLERSAAIGTGISAEGAFRNYKGINYSGGRLVMTGDAMTFREACLDMDEEFISPIWMDFVDHVYVINRLRPAPAVQSLYSHRIQHPKPEWVDPLKEAQGWTLKIEQGLTSRSRACAAMGEDFDEIHQELVNEKKMRERDGLEPDEAERAAQSKRNAEQRAKIIEVSEREDEETA